MHMINAGWCDGGCKVIVCFNAVVARYAVMMTFCEKMSSTIAS